MPAAVNRLPMAFAALAMLVSTAGIVTELVRTRLLVDVKPELRLSSCVHRPRLLSLSQHV